MSQLRLPLIHEPQLFLPLPRGPFCSSGDESQGRAHIIEKGRDVHGDLLCVGTRTEDFPVKGVES